jgi:prevent-host-death family protein
MDQIPSQATMSIGAYDAKTRLSELLDRVEKGEQIVITRHGKPVARLVPEGGHDRAAARAAVARLFALGERLARQGVNLTDEEIRALRDEGRR